MLRYYENPRTIGSVTAGIEPHYRYPQVVVISDEKRPLLIIRSEQNAQGSLFFCSLDANGRHSNWGEVALLTRDNFVRKAGKLLLRIKYGEEGRVELKTQKDRGKPTRPSDYELGSRIASVIDGFITTRGVSEFASNRLHVVIDEEYRASISAAGFIKNALVSVPLSDLKLELVAIRESGPLRHMALDIAAMSVIAQLGQ